MCKDIDNIRKNFNRLGEIAIQTVRKNKELEQYNVLGQLAIEGNRDIIYVSDVDTYELLFMNQNAINVFGDKLGQKCCTVFHNLKEPCKYCNNKKLVENIGSPITWVFYNQLSKELYYITDIVKEVDGRLLRFERATPLNGLTKEIVKIANKYQLL